MYMFHPDVHCLQSIHSKVWKLSPWYYPVILPKADHLFLTGPLYIQKGN